MRLCKNKTVRRTFAALVCMVLTVASLGIYVEKNPLEVGALSSYEIQQKINEYEQKQKEIQGKIDALQGDKADAQKKAEHLESQVDAIESKVSLMNQKVNALQSEIDKINSQINQKETEIKDAKELLKKRLRAICIAGASTDLLVLLSAEDYSDFLMKSDIMKRITTDTKNVMESLEAEIVEINKDK